MKVTLIISRELSSWVHSAVSEWARWVALASVPTTTLDIVFLTGEDFSSEWLTAASPELGENGVWNEREKLDPIK